MATIRPLNTLGNVRRSMNSDPRVQELVQRQSGGRASGRGSFGSDYAVNPTTRSMTSQIANSEANRLRSLDEFGIQNRMAQEQLAFQKKIQQQDMALKLLGIRNERDALKDARRGSNIGLAIGIGNLGLDYYDRNQDRLRMKAQQDEEQRRHEEYISALYGRPYSSLIQQEPYNQVHDTTELLNRAYLERLQGDTDRMYHGPSRFDHQEFVGPAGLSIGIGNNDIY